MSGHIDFLEDSSVGSEEKKETNWCEQPVSTEKETVPKNLRFGYEAKIKVPGPTTWNGFSSGHPFKY